MSDDAELERLRLKARALDLLDELGIYGRLREEMLRDPERAIAVLEYAVGEPGIQNPASFAISSWRRGDDPRKRSASARAREELPQEQPPTLSALEYAWSREGSAVGGALLKMMSHSIERAGGMVKVLEAGWLWRERYDEDGELLSRDLLPPLPPLPPRS